MKTLIPAISTVAVGLFALPASAGLIYYEFEGNDCSGYFGKGEACQIFIDQEDERIEISPLIAKYEPNGTVDEKNSDYGTFDGEEISFSGDATGSWTYTPDPDDPGIRYWSVKAGNGFNLFWYVDDANDNTCSGNTYTLACLELAEVVTEGTWFTPGEKGLSHIAFYNSEPPTYVPEPGSIALLGLGLLGLGLTRRRAGKA
ncbi:MAG: PEP-CTERM sorting domain-containing protein [Alteromonadaceae bacterium]|nr:PEP-CTERM sorting domain-containing protein [Alteromonadaceae bacterium]